MEEKEFIWTDKLVLEFANFTKNDSPAFQGRYADLEQFKQSKQNQYPPGIISFKAPNDIIHRTGFKITYNQWVEWATSNNYKIHSVQNGDEILTVWDSVIIANGEREDFVIAEFKIIQDKIFACGNGTDKYYDIAISLLNKKEQKTYTASEVQNIYFGYKDKNGESQNGFVSAAEAGKLIGMLMEKEAKLENIIDQISQLKDKQSS